MYNPERCGHPVAPCYTQPPLAGRIVPYDGPRVLTFEMHNVLFPCLCPKLPLGRRISKRGYCSRIRPLEGKRGV